MLFNVRTSVGNMFFINNNILSDVEQPIRTEFFKEAQ